MKLIILICLTLLGLTGCHTESDKKYLERYIEFMAENIFYEETVSLSPYYPLKDSEGRQYRADSIFRKDKIVFRFTQHDCEDCIQSEIEHIRQSGLSKQVIGIASYNNLRVLRMALQKYRIDFPVFFLPFEREKDVFPVTETIRRPFVFLMTPHLQARYYFSPDAAFPNMSQRYYQEMADRLGKQATDAAEIFQENLVDLGEIELNKSYEVRFPFTNRSEGLLIIKEVKTSCGCTVPQWSKEPLQEGRSSELIVQFTPNARGYNRKNIMVFHNKAQYPERLVIKANVK